MLLRNVGSSQPKWCKFNFTVEVMQEFVMAPSLKLGKDSHKKNYIIFFLKLTKQMLNIIVTQFLSKESGEALNI